MCRNGSYAIRICIILLIVRLSQVEIHMPYYTILDYETVDSTMLYHTILHSSILWIMKVYDRACSVIRVRVDR